MGANQNWAVQLRSRVVTSALYSQGPITAGAQFIPRVFLGEQEKVKCKVKAISITEHSFLPHEWDLLPTHFIYSLCIQQVFMEELTS